MRDLISREDVIIIATSSCLDLDSYDDTDEFCNEVKEIPSAFEGMTNGEVILALFPNGKVIECDEATGYEQMLDDENSYCSWFDSLWWNAPYKAESEGTE